MFLNYLARRQAKIPKILKNSKKSRKYSSENCIFGDFCLLPSKALLKHGPKTCHFCVVLTVCFWFLWKSVFLLENGVFAIQVSKHIIFSELLKICFYTRETDFGRPGIGSVYQRQLVQTHSRNIMLTDQVGSSQQWQNCKNVRFLIYVFKIRFCGNMETAVKIEHICSKYAHILSMYFKKYPLPSSGRQFLILCGSCNVEQDTEARQHRDFYRKKVQERYHAIQNFKICENPGGGLRLLLPESRVGGY